MTPPMEEIKKLLMEESYAHLHECDCGCDTCGGDEKDPKAKGKKKLDEKPKKEESLDAADKVTALVEGLRRRNKVGVKQWRKMKKTSALKNGKARKISATPKARMAVRAKAAHNRHR